MDYMEKDFGKILKNNAQTLRHDLLPKGTDCFRVYDRNLSRYPVTVDIYGKYAKVTDYGEVPMSDEVRSSCLDICSRMLYLEPGRVIYSYRAKRQEGVQHEKAQTDAVRTVVHENGLAFNVDLTTYVDTGLFLDHSLTRQLIRERSANAEVLNLFSYTGSFSVYAAAGLAESVTSVDMSATYTKWAQENLEANGYTGDMYRCICMDATRFVKEAIGKGQKYDIIIFDPPSFSNSRKMDGDFDVARDYADWIKNLFRILKKTGIILFSTNLGTFRMDRRRFRGLSVREITGLVSAPGFVKGRTGTARSWMMAFDDSSLSLDWSEPEKKEQGSVKGSDRREGASERKPYRRENREGGRRDDRRDERPYDRRRSEGRDGERRYSSDRPRYERKEYRPRDRYRDEEREDRPRYGERAEKPYGRRRIEGEGQRYERSERPAYKDRDRDRDDRRRTYGDRDSRPRYDRDDRPRRDFDRNRDNDRPARRFDREDRPARSFDRDCERGSERGERSFQRRESSDRRPAKGPSRRPYGYDSFKPARSREDSSDFFWNEEDLDNNR